MVFFASRHRSRPAVLRKCHQLKVSFLRAHFHSVVSGDHSKHRHYTSTTRTVTAEQVSTWNLPFSARSVSIVKLRESYGCGLYNNSAFDWTRSWQNRKWKSSKHLQHKTLKHYIVGIITKHLTYLKEIDEMSARHRSDFDLHYVGYCYYYVGRLLPL